MRALLAAAAAAGSLLLGLLAGTASVALHRLGPGMVLALLATATTVLALRAWWPRMAAAFALGWLVPVGGAVLGRPEGDYAVATDLRGYALMAAGLVVTVVAVTSLGARDSGSGGART